MPVWDKLWQPPWWQKNVCVCVGRRLMRLDLFTLILSMVDMISELVVEKMWRRSKAGKWCKLMKQANPRKTVFLDIYCQDENKYNQYTVIWGLWCLFATKPYHLKYASQCSSFNRQLHILVTDGLNCSLRSIVILIFRYCVPMSFSFIFSPPLLLPVISKQFPYLPFPPIEFHFLFIF